MCQHSTLKVYREWFREILLLTFPTEIFLVSTLLSVYYTGSYNQKMVSFAIEVTK